MKGHNRSGVDERDTLNTPSSTRKSIQQVISIEEQVKNIFGNL